MAHRLPFIPLLFHVLNGKPTHDLDWRRRTHNSIHWAVLALVHAYAIFGHNLRRCAIEPPIMRELVRCDQNSMRNVPHLFVVDRHDGQAAVEEPIEVPPVVFRGA